MAKKKKKEEHHYKGFWHEPRDLVSAAIAIVALAFGVLAYSQAAPLAGPEGGFGSSLHDGLTCDQLWEMRHEVERYQASGNFTPEMEDGFTQLHNLMDSKGCFDRPATAHETIIAGPPGGPPPGESPECHALWQEFDALGASGGSPEQFQALEDKARAMGCMDEDPTGAHHPPAGSFNPNPPLHFGSNPPPINFGPNPPPGEYHPGEYGSHYPADDHNPECDQLGHRFEELISRGASPEEFQALEKDARALGCMDGDHQGPPECMEIDAKFKNLVAEGAGADAFRQLRDAAEDMGCFMGPDDHDGDHHYGPPPECEELAKKFDALSETKADHEAFAALHEEAVHMGCIEPRHDGPRHENPECMELMHEFERGNQDGADRSYLYGLKEKAERMGCFDHFDGMPHPEPHHDDDYGYDDDYHHVDPSQYMPPMPEMHGVPMEDYCPNMYGYISQVEHVLEQLRNWTAGYCEEMHEPEDDRHHDYRRERRPRPQFRTFR